jgi:DNA (cytosine-5)-methyltransferase 1
VNNTQDIKNFDAYLEAAQKLHPNLDMAKRLGTSERTLRRWRTGEVLAPQLAVEEVQRLLNFGPKTATKGDFTFIDLFAGVGGIRLAFESIGGECVFTSEWDDYAKKTYRANFLDGHQIKGDITQIDENDIDEHDVLLGGFPCQPFSIAGVSKKNIFSHNNLINWKGCCAKP